MENSFIRSKKKMNLSWQYIIEILKICPQINSTVLLNKITKLYQYNSFFPFKSLFFDII